MKHRMPLSMPGDGTGNTAADFTDIRAGEDR